MAKKKPTRRYVWNRAVLDCARYVKKYAGLDTLSNEIKQQFLDQWVERKRTKSRKVLD